ncbi:BRISC and BRCA1-A complex member 1 [Plutella xylostella]|uniref:BRISC and BRCA1-A complex member 1 n=1 Tax=Plutella xylostella TaxID=51655 RepID=UPI002032A54B|nr:BRISC and BRCA1-A complex member 1 [Plutella xylostella]
MESPEILSSCTSRSASEPEDQETGNLETTTDKPNENYMELQEQVIQNLRKPNVPNVNVPEKIIICLDVCYDNQNTLFRLGDGTTFTPINMLKRVLDFFIHSKHAINKRTEFALLVMKDTEPIWVQHFTNNVKEVISSIDHINPEGSTSEQFDFKKVFNILKQKVEIPAYKQEKCIVAPSHIVRMIVLFGRSNCLPIIPQDDEYFAFLKNQLYFYIDILFAHEDDCALYKCEEVYDALQDLDNGYSFVFEVSRNAAKIHDSIAKLLAHPLQRPLQKCTDYAFGSKHRLLS